MSEHAAHAKHAAAAAQHADAIADAARTAFTAAADALACLASLPFDRPDEFTLAGTDLARRAEQIGRAAFDVEHAALALAANARRSRDAYIAADLTPHVVGTATLTVR